MVGGLDVDVEELDSFDLDVDVDKVLSLLFSLSFSAFFFDLGLFSLEDDVVVFVDDVIVLVDDDVMREEMTFPSRGFRAVLDFMIFILSAFKLQVKHILVVRKSQKP